MRMFDAVRLAGAGGVLMCVAWAGAQAPAPEAAPQGSATLEALIKQHPEDDRVASWQVDRAIAELASLSVDGADTSLLFGVPTAEQRRRGAEAARRAMALLDDADAKATESVRRLEEGMMGKAAADPEALRRARAAEEALARLVDVEQAQRIPYYRAAAQTLLAAASEGPARAQAARQAAAALARMTLSTPGADAARRVLLVGAIVNGTVIDDAARHVAGSELDAVDAAGDGIDETTRQRAAMARLLLGAGADDRAIGAMPARQHEALARRLLERARSEPARRTALTAEACRVLLAGAPSGALRAGEAGPERLLLYARVAALITPGVDTAALPSEAILARAVALLREDERSQEARALLSQLLTRTDVRGDLRAAALWEAAAVYTRTVEPRADARAIEYLDQFVQEFPEDERAPAAARTLEALAARAQRVTEVLVARRTALEDIQLRALDLLLAHPAAFPGQLGEWKSRAIVIRVGRLDPSTVTPAQLGPLVKEAATIDRPRPSGANLAVNELARRMFEDARWPERPAEDRVKLIETVRSSRDPISDDHIALLAGEAKAELARADAVDELRPLVGGALDGPDQPTRVRLRLALARALGGMPAGRAEAITLLRQLVAPLDNAPSSAKRPAYYWQAWATTLEYLQADNADGARDDAIRAQARRLELLDPGMGGRDTADRIRRVRDAAGKGGGGDDRAPAQR